MNQDASATTAFQRSLELCGAGRVEEALAALDDAVRLRPDFAEAHSNRGVLLTELGRLDEAAIACRTALALRPQFADAANNLGVCLQMLGRIDEAAAAFRHAVQADANNAKAAYNLAHLLTDAGQRDDAAALLERALNAQPTFSEAALELGNIHLDAGRYEQAETLYRRAASARPGYAEAWYNLGNALRLQDRIDDAIDAYRRATEARADFAAAHNNLGNLLKDQGRHAEAEAAYRTALRHQPAYSNAQSNLGLLLLDCHRLEEAEAAFRNALAQQADEPEYINSLGCVLQALGRLDEADEHFRRACALDATFVKAHTNRLTLAHYRPGVTLAELARLHDEWNARHAAALAEPIVLRDRDSERPLRLGFVSPDFGRHPVGYFTIRVLESLDRVKFEAYCYSDRVRHDDLTTRFRAAARAWRDVRLLSDNALAQQIRSDGIDILFDLAGHTGSNRMRTFARRAAPVQITWAGYVGTTGLAAMDYLLADVRQVPPESEPHYRERILRMPGPYVTYDPPNDAPDVACLPAESRGHVTFGCFNNLAKVNREVIHVWARILARVPGSRLFLKFRGVEGANRERLERQFADAGVSADRLLLEGVAPHHELLAAYGRVDLALDPFPYSGGLTTLEALWMGVPVVTCPGETFASRHALAHLAAVGLTEFVASDFDEYVAIAERWATHLPALALVRAELRERVRRSPLCAAEAFTRHFEQILRDVWRDATRTRPRT